jgi:ribosomal protein S18 acetylase RimI-like enzyme
VDVSVREIRAAGLDALTLATEMLQCARRADPQAGLREAADAQWRWRRPRRSDGVEKLLWIDDDGPVAGVLLTSWTDDAWQCDPVVLPRASGVEAGVVWTRAMEHAREHSAEGFEVPVSDDDRTFRELAPAIRTHPDLAVETADGRVAGYSLYWFDPTTKVGLVEPVTVEDQFQRQGLARAMLSAGVNRLVTRGAQRVKVAYETDAAAALYQGLGFRRTSTATWYRASSG